MLIAVKEYFLVKKTVNLQELSLHFKQQPETIRCLLQHWVRKGKVCRAVKPAGCGSRCQLCKPSVAEVYEWRGEVIFLQLLRATVWK